MRRGLRARARTSWRGERGQVAGIEAIPFGILIFVIGTLLVTNAWAVIDAKMATDAAAREATRAYVEGWPDPARSASQADLRGREAATAQGRHGDRVRFARSLDHGYQRCSRVTITASYQVPALSLPFIGGFGHGFAVSASHSEVIDPYRSGGSVGARCG